MHKLKSYALAYLRFRSYFWWLLLRFKSFWKQKTKGHKFIYIDGYLFVCFHCWRNLELLKSITVKWMKSLLLKFNQMGLNVTRLYSVKFWILCWNKIWRKLTRLYKCHKQTNVTLIYIRMYEYTSIITYFVIHLMRGIVKRKILLKLYNVSHKNTSNVLNLLIV